MLWFERILRPARVLRELNSDKVPDLICDAIADHALEMEFPVDDDGLRPVRDMMLGQKASAAGGDVFQVGDDFVGATIVILPSDFDQFRAEQPGFSASFAHISQLSAVTKEDLDRQKH
jgi:hypothetical protein